MKKQLIIIVCLILISTIFYGFKKLANPIKVMSIGVVVSDLEESYKFYTEIIGMEQIDTFHMSSEMSAKYAVNSGKEFNIINLRMKCDGYSLIYKLNKTVGNLPEVTFKNKTDYYGFEKIGSNYFSIDVEDVAAYKERLDKNHIDYKYLVISEWNDYKVILVYDPDGVLLEIRGN